MSQKITSLIKAVVFAILVMIVIVIGNCIAFMNGLDKAFGGAGYYLTLGITNAFCIIGMLIYSKKRNIDLNNFVSGHFSDNCCKDTWYLLPLVLDLVLPMTMLVIKDDLTVPTILCLFIFSVTIGITEELAFRVLIPNLLKNFTRKQVIFISAGLFGMVHIITGMRGDSILIVLARIIYAVTFGYVCMELIFITNNVVVLIMWHSLHDFITYITFERIKSPFIMGNQNVTYFVFEVLQLTVLLIYAIGIRKAAK